MQFSDGSSQDIALHKTSDPKTILFQKKQSTG